MAAPSDPRRPRLPRFYGPLYTSRGAPSPPAALLRAPPECLPQQGARGSRPSGREEPHPAPPRRGLSGPPRPHRPPVHWQRRPAASSGARVTAAPERGPGGGHTRRAPPLLARLVWPTSATQAPLTRPRVSRTVTAHSPLAPAGHPPTIRGGHRRRQPGQHPGPTLRGMPVSRLGPPSTLGHARPLALGRRDGDPFRRGNCDGRTPGPHTRGTRYLPVKRGHVDSRQGRSDPVCPKRPLALARESCPTVAYFESFRWRSTCDRPVTHQPQPRSCGLPGTSKSPGRPPVKGQILCKPDLDH